MNTETSKVFPRGNDLQKFLNLVNQTELDDLFARSISEPLESVMSRPKKNFRGQLVSLGFKFACERRGNPVQCREAVLEQAMEVLELLHTGSLVVDDIEDGSTHRRGGPTVHSVYGVPVALNAGNWLYFLPFQKIEEMDVSETIRASLLRECHSTLLRAHYGQALDVGVPFDSIERTRLPDVAIASMELKSGALTGFAFKVGAIVAEAETRLLEVLDIFGRRFGVALQMFDDIGNISSEKNIGKWSEDVRLKRLTFISAIAAKHLNETDYAQFLGLIGRSDCNQIFSFLEATGTLRRARSEASAYLKHAINELDADISLTSEERLLLMTIQKKLEGAYV